MAYWDWSPSYEIGIDVIDKQHKKIVSYINELHEILLEKELHRVPEIIYALTNYTISHFSFEESLMEQADYPLIEAHKKVHKSFIELINKYSQRYQNGEDIVGQLMAELQIWLTHHILNDDKDYKIDVIKMLYEKQLKRNRPPEKKKGWFARLFG